MTRLHRSSRDRFLAGVLGGIAETYHLDPGLVRLAFALLLLATGFFPFVLIYIIAMFVLPMR